MVRLQKLKMELDPYCGMSKKRRLEGEVKEDPLSFEEINGEVDVPRVLVNNGVGKRCFM